MFSTIPSSLYKAVEDYDKAIQLHQRTEDQQPTTVTTDSYSFTHKLKNEDVFGTQEIDPFLFTIVADGHKGNAVATFFVEQFPTFFLQTEGVSLKERLTQTFVELQKHIWEDPSLKNSNSGTSACVTLFHKETADLFVATLADCEAVLFRDETSFSLSQKIDWNKEKERKRAIGWSLCKKQEHFPSHPLPKKYYLDKKFARQEQINVSRSIGHSPHTITLTKKQIEVLNHDLEKALAREQMALDQTILEYFIATLAFGSPFETAFKAKYQGKDFHQDRQFCQKKIEDCNSINIYQELFQEHVPPEFQGDIFLQELRRMKKEFTDEAKELALKEFKPLKLGRDYFQVDKDKFYLCLFSPKPKVVQLKPVRGDQIVIATDGLWDYLPVEDVNSQKTGQLKPQQLVDQAIQQGSKDDITAMVLTFHH